MRLVPCTPPAEPLESAPQTALVVELESGPGTRWEGFWSHASDAYYARRTQRDGRIEWFRMDDEALARDAEVASSPRARVLPFRGDAMRRVSVVVAETASGRAMLVGASRRVPRQ
jgi:hypothetical protein